MKSGSLFLVLLVACAMGGGYWLGQRHARSGVVEIALPGSKKLPVVPAIHAGSDEPVAASGRLSLAEIEAGILNLKPLDVNDLEFQPNLLRLLTDLKPGDIPALLAFIDKQVPRSLRWPLQSQIMQIWAGADIAAAMAHADQMTDRTDRVNAINLVAGTWAGKDAAGAIAWARQLPQGDLRRQVMNSIIGTLATIDPSAALNLMATDRSRYSVGNVASIFQAWALKDPVAAAAKAAALVNNNDRAQALDAVASTWAGADPSAAMKWAGTLAGTGLKNQIMNSILNGWGSNDAASALACAQQLPDSQSKQSMLDNLSRQ